MSNFFGFSSGVHVALLFKNSPLFPAECDFNSQLSCPNNTQNTVQLPMPSPSQFVMPMLTTTANLKHVINFHYDCDKATFKVANYYWWPMCACVQYAFCLIKLHYKHVLVVYCLQHL